MKFKNLFKKQSIQEQDAKMMKTLKTLEGFSTCSAKHVCCILAETTRKNKYKVRSVGFNGVSYGETPCKDIWERQIDENGQSVWYNKKTKTLEGPTAHSEWSLNNEIHAEIDALAKCALLKKSTEGFTAFISYSPCYNCSKTLIAFGIKRIVFREKYDDFDSNVKTLLENNGIEVVQLSE